MYYRQVGDLPIRTGRFAFLMLTEGDAKYAAAHLGTLDHDHCYIAEPRFLGYEGPDFGVTRNTGNVWGRPSKFLGWVSVRQLIHICWDRPIVPQAEAWDHKDI